MNKYQEALDNVDKCRVNKTLNINIKDILILQELVDKATPKKPEYLNYGGYKIGNYHCPNCNSIIVIDNRNYKLPKYCDECGQAFDWSDEDDK